MYKLAIKMKGLFKLRFVLLDGRFALCCTCFGGRAKGWPVSHCSDNVTE